MLPVISDEEPSTTLSTHFFNPLEHLLSLSSSAWNFLVRLSPMALDIVQQGEAKRSPISQVGGRSKLSGAVLR
jgi:hypothetical protein